MVHILLLIVWVTLSPAYSHLSGSLHRSKSILSHNTVMVATIYDGLSVKRDAALTVVNIFPPVKLPRPFKVSSNNYSNQNRKVKRNIYIDQSKIDADRNLTPMEEETAARISMMGNLLHKLRAKLAVDINRTPTNHEWAQYCNMSPEDLEQYIHIVFNARKLLVECNIRLVDYIVNDIMRTSSSAKKLSYMELVSEGVTGLTAAAKRFDGRNRFSTFAYIYVKDAVLRAITRLQPGSLISHRDAILHNRMKKISYHLRRSLARIPKDEEVAQKLNVTVQYLINLRTRANRRIDSGNQGLPIQHSGAGREDSTSTQSYFDLDLVTQKDVSASEQFAWTMTLQVALSCLEPFEKRVLGLRYGYIDGAARTLPVVAELMCVSEEFIRRTINAALAKLKASPAAEALLIGPPEASPNTLDNKIRATKY